MDDAVQDDDPSRPPRRVQDEDARRVGRELLMPADTCVAPVLSVPELVDDPAVRRARRVRRSRPPDRGPLPPGRAGARRAKPTPDGPYHLRDATDTDVDELLARRRASPPTRSRLLASTKESSRDRSARRRAEADRRSRSTEIRASSRSSRATSGRPARRSRTATRCSGTTTSPPRSPAGRSRRRRWCRCGSDRTTGARVAPNRRCRCRCTST